MVRPVINRHQKVSGKALATVFLTASLLGCGGGGGGGNVSPVTPTTPTGPRQVTLAGDVLVPPTAVAREASAKADDTVPVANCNVSFEDGHGNKVGATVQTDANGHYELPTTSGQTGELVAKLGNRELRSLVSTTTDQTTTVSRNITVDTTVAVRLKKDTAFSSYSADEIEGLLEFGITPELRDEVTNSFKENRAANISEETIQTTVTRVKAQEQALDEDCPVGSSWCVTAGLLIPAESDKSKLQSTIVIRRAKGAQDQATVGSGRVQLSWPSGFTPLTVIAAKQERDGSLMVRSKPKNEQNRTDVFFLNKEAQGYKATTHVFTVVLSGTREAPPGQFLRPAVELSKLRGVLGEKRSVARMAVEALVP